MCTLHADLIDAATQEHTVEQLELWKSEAVRLAKEAMKCLGRPEHNGLSADFAETTRPASVNQKIGSTLARAGVLERWGIEARDCVQDLFIEVARNALEHGGASTVTVQVEADRLILTDDGAPFNPLERLRTPSADRGGAAAIAQLFSKAHSFLVFYDDKPGPNTLTVLKPGPGVATEALTECTLRLDLESFRDAPEVDLSSFQACSDIVIAAPEYMSLSDAYKLGQVLRDARADRMRVHFVLRSVSAFTVRVLAQYLPLAHFMLEE